jgi:heat shock protein HtpX
MRPRAELWDQQSRNRRNTVFLIFVFVLLLFLLGAGVDLFLLDRVEGGARHGRFLPIAACIALIVGIVQSIGGYYGGAQGVLASTHARPADPNDPRERVLLNVVEEMRLASGLPAPRVYVVPDADPNAFAVGRDPEHAAIAVTAGLLDQLDREELQGVVAHEMAHVRNFDIRTMTLVAALLGAVVLLSDFAARAVRWGGVGGSRGRSSNRERGGGGGGGVAMVVLFVVWLVLLILAPLLARLMAFGVSRSREYDADASGAEFTRNPTGLAQALRKIDAAVDPTRSIKRGSAHLCIADPAGRQVNNHEGWFASLLGTHPPITKRIALLESMAGTAGMTTEPNPVVGGAS